MIFGYLWTDPRAISDDQQRQYLADAGADPRRIVRDQSPDRGGRNDMLAVLRPGDVVAVYRTRYLADDSLDFISVVGRIAARSARLAVINLGVEIEPDSAVTDLIETDIAERRKRQTEAAREARKRLPKGKRGGAPRTEVGWNDEQRKRFRQMWALPPGKCSMREIAREFGISAPAVGDIAIRMKLPPRGA